MQTAKYYSQYNHGLENTDYLALKFKKVIAFKLNSSSQ